MAGDRPGRDLCYKVNWCFACKREKKDVILAFSAPICDGFCSLYLPWKVSSLRMLLPGSDHLVHA